MPVIASQYAGKCRTCKSAHAVGDRVWWERSAKGVQCLSCHASPAHEAPRVVSEANDGTVVVDGRHLREFGSWGEFVDYAEEHKNIEQGSHGKGDAYDADAEWFGSKTYDDAVVMARHGWSAIRPEVDALVEKIDSVIAPVLQPAFSSYFDVSGGTVDVGRFLDGEPECMVETKLVNIAKPGRVVSILIDGFYSSGIDSASIVKRGVAIIALIDSLEKMQHSTEIWVETSFRDGTNKAPLTYLIKLKGADDVFDIDTLMFVVANPAAYRRIGLAAQERTGENKRYRVGNGNSYGGPAGLKMGKRVDAALELPRLVYGDETADGEVWVKKVLSNFGLVREES